MAALLLELALHIVDPLRVTITPGHLRLATNQRYVVHNDRIPGLQPVITHTINSLGFRGEEPPSELASYLKIVAVGGSTTASLYQSDERTWVELLGKSLGRSLSRVWVNDAGLDGQSTFGHLLLMRDYVTRLDPDVVLFLVGANDVGRLDLNDYDLEMLRDASRLDENGPQAGPEASLGHLLRDSKLYPFVLTLLRTALVKENAIVHESLDLSSLPVRDSTDVQREAALETAARALPEYRHRLLELVALARERGIEPVLMTQPALFGTAIDDATGVDLARVAFRGANGGLAWQTFELYNNTTREVGQSERVFVVDLARELPKSSRYFYDWIHYTDSGAQEVARLVGRRLCPWLAERYPVRAQGPCTEID